MSDQPDNNEPNQNVGWIILLICWAVVSLGLIARGSEPLPSLVVGLILGALLGLPVAAIAGLVWSGVINARDAFSSFRRGS